MGMKSFMPFKRNFPNPVGGRHIFPGCELCDTSLARPSVHPPSWQHLNQFYTFHHLNFALHNRTKPAPEHNKEESLGSFYTFPHRVTSILIANLNQYSTFQKSNN